MLNIIKRLRWKNIMVSLLGVIILVGIGSAVVLLTGKNKSELPPETSPSQTVSEENQAGTAETLEAEWVDVAPTVANIDHTPKEIAIDPSGKVLDHSREFMTYYTNSPEGVAVASSLDLITSAGHTVLNNPIRSGVDLSANNEVQSNWVGGGNYTNLGGLHQSIVNIIRELDSFSKIERIGLLWPTTTRSETSKTGTPYTLTVTSALFKTTSKEGSVSYFVISIQNSVNKSTGLPTFKIHPVSIQALRLFKVEDRSTQAALNDFFAQEN